MSDPEAVRNATRQSLIKSLNPTGNRDRQDFLETLAGTGQDRGANQKNAPHFYDPSHHLAAYPFLWEDREELERTPKVPPLPVAQPIPPVSSTTGTSTFIRSLQSSDVSAFKLAPEPVMTTESSSSLVLPPLPTIVKKSEPETVIKSVLGLFESHVHSLPAERRVPFLQFVRAGEWDLARDWLEAYMKHEMQREVFLGFLESAMQKILKML